MAFVERRKISFSGKMVKKKLQLFEAAHGLKY